MGVQVHIIKYYVKGFLELQMLRSSIHFELYNYYTTDTVF